MAQTFSKPFYDSVEWKECRKSYISKMPIYKRGLCEKCYANGKHVLGKELHHKVPLTPYNIHNRDITLNHKKLILLCFDCHQEEHNKRTENRYMFDERGNVIPPPLTKKKQ